MRWPEGLRILWNLLDGEFGGWIFCLVGILAAVVLHLRDKKARLWPALAAIALWQACEYAGNHAQSYGIEMLALLIGFFTIGYAAAWLVLDLVLALKNRKKALLIFGLYPAAGIPVHNRGSYFVKINQIPFQVLYGFSTSFIKVFHVCQGSNLD